MQYMLWILSQKHKDLVNENYTYMNKEKSNIKICFMIATKLHYNSNENENEQDKKKTCRKPTTTTTIRKINWRKEQKKNLTWACTCSLCCITKVKYLTINSRWKNTRQTKQTNQWFYSRCALWFWLDSSLFSFLLHIFGVVVWFVFICELSSSNFFFFLLAHQYTRLLLGSKQNETKKKWSKTNLENQR